MKSHADLMADFPTELQRLDESISNSSKDIGRSLLESSDPRTGNSSSVPMFGVVISHEGRRNMRECAETWRVSESAMVRMFVTYGLAKFGFASTAVLSKKDAIALTRAPSVNRPFQMKEEARRKGHRRFKKNVPLAEDLGSHHAPQP